MSAKWRTCCTCGPFKPKWMKMVDNIYKSSPNDSSYHSKLLQFCVRKPDKLDRIALYLYKHLAYHLNHNNDNNVNLTVEAINSLMNACHQRLNLFVVHYLKMIQLLLESNKVEHQLQGCKSFMQFSQLTEDTASYHKEYEYLIQHFSKLAHSNFTQHSERDKLRISGIKGIKGVVRKCTMDQLQVNVIDLRCLNLIVPALLFNMQMPDILEKEKKDKPPAEETPATEAASAFREIIIRASFNVQPVISSIFTYLDEHKLWDPPEFTLYVLEIFLENIKNTQAAYTLMKQLVSHLSNDDNQFGPQERTGIVKAINKTVISLAAQAVGPDIFHNFKSLLQILRQSIESTSSNNTASLNDQMDRTSLINAAGASPVASAHQSLDPNNQDPEKQFQDAIITTIAEFAKNLPDTQKIEIMKFILNFDSMCFDKANSSRQLVRVLLKTMLQVATQYKTGSIAIIFNSDFLNLLLNGVAVDRDPGNRIFVQKILHTLIDRHDNTAKLSIIKIMNQKELYETYTVDKPSRQDLIFMKKNGAAIIDNLFLQLIDSTNKVNNLENIYCTLCLISMEMGAEHVIVDLYRLMFGVQDYILEFRNKTPHSIPITHQCALHALIAAFINVLTIIADLPQVANHINQIISQRLFKAKYYLPDMAFNRSNTANSYPNQVCVDDNLFFSRTFVKDRLSAKNYDITFFDVPFKSKPGQRLATQNLAQGEIHDMKMLSQSMTSLSISESGSIILEEDDQLLKLKGSDDELTFDAIKKVLEEPNEERNKRRLAEEMEMNKYFREVGFEKICKDQREKYQPVRQNLQEILHNTAVASQHSSGHFVTPANSHHSHHHQNPRIDFKPHLIEPNANSAPHASPTINAPHSNNDNLPDIWQIEYPDIFLA